MGKKQKKRIRIGFKTKILGLSLPLTILMVVILILIAYTISRTNIISSSQRLLNTSAKDQSHQVESWLNQKLREISTVKYDIEHSDALTNNESMQQKLDNYYNLDSDFMKGIYLSDLNGTVIKATKDTETISSPTSQIWFTEGITRMNPGFTKAYINQAGVPIISASGMLNDTNNLRVLSADLTLDSINIIVNSSVSMPNAQSLLIDKTDGTILVARESSLVSTTLDSATDPFLLHVADNIARNDYNLCTLDNNCTVMREITGTNWVLVSYIALDYITASANSLRLNMILVALICLIILCVLSYFVIHIAVRPLKKLTGKIKAMSDGDFTISVEPKGNDEITDIQRSVSTFIISMQQMIREITDISDEIQSQADNSSMVAQDMLEASKAQADSMEALNNTVDQFSVSIMEIAENATELSGVVADTTRDSEEVKEKIDSTVSISKKGRSDMQRVSEAMGTIRTSIHTLVEAINKVGQASKEITGIIGFIGDISEETSLLSLNASIEAARAGEAGKGFAVVASEISKLADTTAGSVENISNLIQEVDSLIGAAVQQADVSVENINESSGRIQVAVNTFDDIYERIQSVEEVIGKMVGEVQVVNSVAMDVSAVSEEQAASTEMVHSTSEQMVEQANNLSMESEKVAEGAKVLTQTSENLTRHMNKFKVS